MEINCANSTSTNSVLQVIKQRPQKTLVRLHMSRFLSSQEYLPPIHIVALFSRAYILGKLLPVVT